jgi:gluconolactonase
MFHPPAIIDTEVFARIPDRYRRPGRRSPWADVQHGEARDCFIEGPAFDRAGNLYIVDIPFGRIFRVSPNGEIDLVTEYDGEPNGLKIHRDGRIFIADHRRGLMILDPASGMVTPLLERDAMDHFKGLNDLCFAANGDLYFTDQGGTGLHDPAGRLYRLRVTGELDCILDNVPSPNGLVLDRGDTHVLMAVTRANALWRVPLLPNGTAFKVGMFIQLSGGTGPDGVAIDEVGNIAIAHVGLGVVWLYSRLGEPLFRIRSCAGTATTNVAYGGSDRRTLFIVESDSGSILTTRLETPGRPMFSHGMDG